MDYDLHTQFDPRSEPVPESTLERLSAFAERWNGRVGREEQLSQSFLNDLCDALGTDRPHEGDGEYAFEHRIAIAHGAGHGKIDLYKAGHFLLEAKCGRNDRSEPGSAPVRGTKPYIAYIQRAYEDQARLYAASLSAPPPLVIVVDIGHRFWIWRRKEGRYAGFDSPECLSFTLDDLADEENARVLWAAFERPEILDVHRFQARVTEEVAETLAPLAASLEARIGDSQRVARFLIRCLFCMFAEDVALLPDQDFTKLLDLAARRVKPFHKTAAALFETMQTGGVFNMERVRRFNGALFRDTEAFELTEAELTALMNAAGLNWAHVEPAIFGTLIERALSARERQRLGAHYTPRSFVERLVRPTVEEPLRFRWNTVLARVRDLMGADLEHPTHDGALKEARELVDAFRAELAGLAILDPACGTGNFLYVSYAVLKELEYEVLAVRDRLEPIAGTLGLKGAAVVPGQFHGIEVDAFAAEIAQLVLWIGHLQWELRHTRFSQISDPVIPEQRSIEHRDALLTWESTTPRIDEHGAPVTRWDWRTFIEAPTHDGLIPDPNARVPVVDLHGVGRAPWPEADFIVGNPPFVGNKMMRDRLGDGYVEALRATYAEVPSTVDYVMYWWHRAGEATASGRTRRFGFITTNSIRQTFNRGVMAALLGDKKAPLRITLAVPDHPWVDDGADVRISMTAAERADGSSEPPLFAEVTAEDRGFEDLDVDRRRVPAIHVDLKVGVDVTQAVPLLANEGLSFQGMNLVGKGFRLTADEVRALGFDPADLPPVIKPYLNAREMMQTRQHRYVIDAFGLSAEELRDAYPSCYQWLLDRVKPERDRNNRASYRDRWWLFGEARGKLRAAWEGLGRYVMTPETSKHRVFDWSPAGTVPDHKLYAVCLDEWWAFGLLQSGAHSTWGLASGGRMGVGNDPTYNNTRCFLPFPFPDLTAAHRARLNDLGERLHTFRDAAKARNPKLTLTTQYNLLAALREGRKLTKKEQGLHAALGTSQLRDLHDALDAAVAEAYGWPTDLDDQQILARLVELNRARADEEARGTVRWLRPDRAPEQVQTQAVAKELQAKAQQKGAPKWPTDKQDPARTERVARVLSTVLHSPAPMTPEAIAQGFKGARRDQVQAIVDQLVSMSLLVKAGEGGAVRGV